MDPEGKIKESRCAFGGCGAVILLELQQHSIARLRVGDTDLIEQLIAIHHSIGRGYFFHSAPAHVGAPGEVSAELFVSHVMIGRVIFGKFGALGAVIGEVRQEHALPVEQLLEIIVVFGWAECDLFRIRQRLRQTFYHLRCCAQDWFVLVFFLQLF